MNRILAIGVFVTASAAGVAAMRPLVTHVPANAERRVDARVRHQSRSLTIVDESSGRRLALVIGNQAYPTAKLANPVNDANDVAAALKKLQFQVTLVTDATYLALSRAIDQFVGQVNQGDVALVYYSGHGFEVGGENYLVPIDFDVPADADAATLRYVTARSAYSAQLLHDRLTDRGARLKILILDACRTSPFRRSRALGEGGLAAMTPTGKGSYIAFAAGPGSTADDNSRGRNGLFTTHLLDAIGGAGLTIDQVFSHVRQAVDQASGGRQVPWVNSSVIGEFCFATPCIAAPSGDETTLWESASNAGTPEAFRQYLARYPQGAYATAAKRLIDVLTKNAAFAESDRSSSKPGVTPPRASPSALDAQCTAGTAASCTDLGVLYATGRGVTRDLARALALYQRACDGGNAVGCNNLGWMYETGQGAAKDVARATTLYQRACDGGNGQGCTNLGIQYANGIGMAKDAGRANTLYQRACTAGNAAGCRNLGGAYANGIGVPKDEARATTFYQQAMALYLRDCDGGTPSGCGNLAFMYHNGQGAAKDDTRAVVLYQRACDGGEAPACDIVGQMYQRGEGVAPDDARAATFYQRSCDAEYAVGCTDLGFLYETGHGVARDVAHAASLFQRGCDGGSAIGCKDLGLAYEHGDGVEKDPARAATLYQRACDGGDGSACTDLGFLYANGIGVAKDLQRAMAFYQRGCAAGDDRGCRLKNGGG